MDVEPSKEARLPSKEKIDPPVSTRVPKKARTGKRRASDDARRTLSVVLGDVEGIATREEKEAMESLFRLAGLIPGKEKEDTEEKEKDASRRFVGKEASEGTEKRRRDERVETEEDRVSEGKKATTSRPSTNVPSLPIGTLPSVGINPSVWNLTHGLGTTNACYAGMGGPLSTNTKKKSSMLHVYIAHMIASQQYLQRQLATLYGAPFYGTALSAGPETGQDKNGIHESRSDRQRDHAGHANRDWSTSGMEPTRLPNVWDGMFPTSTLTASGYTKAEDGGGSVPNGMANPPYAHLLGNAYGAQLPGGQMSSPTAQLQLAQQLQSQLSILQQMGYPLTTGRMSGTADGMTALAGYASGQVHPSFYGGREGMTSPSTGPSISFSGAAPDPTALSGPITGTYGRSEGDSLHSMVRNPPNTTTMRIPTSKMETHGSSRNTSFPESQPSTTHHKTTINGHEGGGSGTSRRTFH